MGDQEPKMKNYARRMSNPAEPQVRVDLPAALLRFLLPPVSRRLKATGQSGQPTSHNLTASRRPRIDLHQQTPEAHVENRTPSLLLSQNRGDSLLWRTYRRISDPTPSGTEHTVPCYLFFFFSCSCSVSSAQGPWNADCGDPCKIDNLETLGRTLSHIQASETQVLAPDKSDCHLSIIHFVIRLFRSPRGKGGD